MLTKALDAIGTQVVGEPTDVRENPEDPNYSLFSLYDEEWRETFEFQSDEQTRLPKVHMQCFSTILHQFEVRMTHGLMTLHGESKSTDELKDMYAALLQTEERINTYERLQVKVCPCVDSLLYWCERQPSINFKPKRQLPAVAVERAARKRFEFDERPQTKAKKKQKKPRGGCAWHLPCSMTVEEMR